MADEKRLIKKSPGRTPGAKFPRKIEAGLPEALKEETGRVALMLGVHEADLVRWTLGAFVEAFKKISPPAICPHCGKPWVAPRKKPKRGKN